MQIATARQFARTLPRRHSRSRLHVVTLPKTFGQAILRGWRVIREESHLEADKRHRWGSVILALAG